MDGSSGSCDVAEGDRVMERAGSDFMAAQIRTDRREAIVSRLPGSIHNQAHPRDQGDSYTFSFHSYITIYSLLQFGKPIKIIYH